MRKALLGLACAALGVTLFGSVAFAAGPREMQGQPTQLAESKPGYFIWQDQDGVHLRLEANEPHRAFVGKIRADGPIADVSETGVQGGKHFSIHKDGRTVRFHFRPKSGAEGLDFRTDGAQKLRVSLGENGLPAPKHTIYLGQDGAHPRHDPFRVTLGS